MKQKHARIDKERVCYISTLSYYIIIILLLYRPNKFDCLLTSFVIRRLRLMTMLTLRKTGTSFFFVGHICMTTSIVKPLAHPHDLNEGELRILWSHELRAFTLTAFDGRESLQEDGDPRDACDRRQVPL